MTAPTTTKRLPPLNALRTFAMAAHWLSFTKAAEALYVTQGAVSRQVKILEDWLRTPLFVRSAHGLELTPQGRELAQGVDQALTHLAKVIDQIQRVPRQNQLAINIPPTFATRWLAPRLADFRKYHPHIDLSITNDFVRHIRDAKQYKCLITFDQQAWLDCDSRLLMHERHVTVASPALWRDGLPPRLENVTLLHVLNGEDRLPVWENWIKTFSLTHIDPAPGLSFSTLDQAINTAIMGAGVAVVDAAMVTRELASGSLRRLNQLEMQGSYGYWFVDLTKDQQNRALVILFREWLQEQLAQAEDIRRVSPTIE